MGDEIFLKYGDNGIFLGEFRIKYVGEIYFVVLGEYIYWLFIFYEFVLNVL